MRGEVRRRARALDVLTRLKEQEIDAVTAEMRRLQDRIAALRDERAALENGLRENARTDTLEGSFFLARYARAVRGQIGQADREIGALTPRTESLEAQMRALFSEAKTYESLRGRIMAGEARARQRREAEALEEMFLMRRVGEAPETDLSGSSRSGPDRSADPSPGDGR